MTDLTWFAAGAAVAFLLRRVLALPFSEDMNANERPTLVPESYPALERECYLALEPATERETYAPPPSSQLTLELACAGVEVEW